MAGALKDDVNPKTLYLPDVPGCIATGSTRQITVKRLARALEMHLAGLREDELLNEELERLRVSLKKKMTPLAKERSDDLGKKPLMRLGGQPSCRACRGAIACSPTTWPRTCCPVCAPTKSPPTGATSAPCAR